MTIVEQLNTIPSSYGSYTGTTTSTYPLSNAYTDMNSSTYSRLTCVTGSKANTYIFYGFDFSAIPSGATITSVTCSCKARVSSTSYIASAYAQLYNGESTAVGSATSIRSTSTTTVYQLDCGTWTDISNMKIRFIATRGTSSTTRAAYLYVYGAEVTVTYEYNESSYTITASAVGGTITPLGTFEVLGGSNQEFNMIADDGYKFKSMTINGVSVTPTLINSTDDATWEVSTNYGTYQTYNLSNINDGDESTYWWSNEVQASGKYIMITFDRIVTLNSFQTYSSSTTDYPQNSNVLQVSYNGSEWETIGTFQNLQTSTFSNINKKCKYVRIYGNSSSSSWLQINEITMNYGYESTYYSYILENIQSDNNIVVIFGKDSTGIFIKPNDTWYQGIKIYKKIDNVWIEQTDMAEVKTYLQSNNIIYNRS